MNGCNAVYVDVDVACLRYASCCQHDYRKVVGPWPQARIDMSRAVPCHMVLKDLQTRLILRFLRFHTRKKAPPSVVHSHIATTITALITHCPLHRSWTLLDYPYRATVNTKHHNVAKEREDSYDRK